MSRVSGTIVSLQICPAHRQPMQFKPKLQAIGNMGLAGDRHAHPRGSRQVLLMDEETLEQMGLSAGMVKENITTRGIALMQLKRGTRIRLGAALFEITKGCEPCERMDEIRMGLRNELEGRRGMLARVIEGGEINVGDAIEIV